MPSDSFLQNIISGFRKRSKSFFDNPYKNVNVSWVKLKYYKHLPSDKIRIHKLFDKSLHFYSVPELLHSLLEIFVENIYKQELQDNPYVIDCGANIGLSIIYMKEQFPKAEIIAFEPDEANFNLLKKNVESFGYSNVVLYKEAVWNENTTLLFTNDSSMSSKIELNNTSKSKEVKAIRLKGFLNRPVDFLKVDIEGAENVVLTDIADNLHFVKNMFLEYHGTFDQNTELVSIMNIVRKAGFNFYIKEAAVLYKTPFHRIKNPGTPYDVQLNIFCFRK